MAVSTIYATYSGSWNHFGGGPFYNWIGQSSQGGNNGGIGGCKLLHYGSAGENRDDFGDCGKGFVQFDTSSIPFNATISEAHVNVQYTKNNFAFGGVAFARSTMAVGWRYDEALDEHYHENIITGNDKPNSGIVDFTFANPNVVVNKGGWSKYHVGTSHSLDMNSPGPAAPVGADDFNMSGYDASGTNRPKLVVTWTTPPAASTGASSNVQGNSATLAGQVTDVGSGTIQWSGICLSSSNPTPTTANTTIDDPDHDTNPFTVNASGLDPNTTYYYRTYVITENSTQYGSVQSFITDTTPAVTSTSVTNQSPIGAVGNGNVTSDGRGTVSERGFVLAKTINPTTANTKYQSGSGTGAYSVNLTGLAPGTTYHVRSYAINGVGTVYGVDIQFTTPSPGIIFLAGM